VLNGFPLDNEFAKFMAIQAHFEALRGWSLSPEAEATGQQTRPVSSLPRASALRKLFGRCTPMMATLRLGVARAVRLFL
jgi:hypothetical protein